MKKLISVIKDALMTCIIVVVLIFTTLYIVIAAPFRCLQYRKSHFYRDTGTPFKIGMMDHFTFVLYELIKKEQLPIRYLMPTDPKRACDGFFLAGSTLLIHDLSGIFFDESLGGWTAYPEDKEPLSDTVAAMLLRLRMDYPNEEVTDVRILLDCDNESAEDQARAEQEPLFLVYDELEDLAQSLRTLFSN
jgi:hypothetical protein